MNSEIHFWEYCPKIGRKWFSEWLCITFWAISLVGGFLNVMTNMIFKSIGKFNCMTHVIIVVFLFVIQLFSFCIALVNLIKYNNFFKGPWEEF